jgi:hypothetical protein
LANGLDFYLNGNHKLEELSLFDLDENLLNELTQLDTHTRNVIQWENEKEEVQFKKISSTPEPVHFNIYQRLKIKNH